MAEIRLRAQVGVLEKNHSTIAAGSVGAIRGGGGRINAR